MKRAVLFWGCRWSGGVLLAQSLPNLVVNRNPSGQVHITWAVPMVSAIFQASSSLSSTSVWQTSVLNVTTSNCACEALLLAGAVGFTDVIRVAHQELFTGRK